MRTPFRRNISAHDNCGRLPKPTRMTKYLIGDAARFDSETFSLVAEQTPERDVQLGAAASRCLLVLLEAGGEIVTKKTLLAQAWEQYGAIVSDNNLSQAILQIRRALQQLGADPAALVTVPRIGYRLTGTSRLSLFVDASTAQSVMPANPVMPIPDMTEVGTPDSTVAVERTPSPLPPEPAPVKALPDVAEMATMAGQAATTPTPRVAPDDDALAKFKQMRAAKNPSLSWGQSTDTPRRGTRPARAIGLWAIAAVASLAVAYAVVPSLRGNLRTNARAAAWVPVDGDTTGRYFITPDHQNDTDYIVGRILALRRMPPQSIDDLAQRRVYINGTRSDDLYSYFLCRGAIDDAAPDCVSYLVTHEKPK